MIKCGHKPISDALSKMLNVNFTNWVQNLMAVFLANESIMRILTALILHLVSYESQLVLLIKLEIFT